MNISTAIQILDFFYEECTDEYLREYKYSLEDFVYEGYEGYEILGIFVANPEVYDILEENIDPVDEYKTDTGTHGGFDYGEEGFTPYEDDSEEDEEDDPEGVPDPEVVLEDNEDESE